MYSAEIQTSGAKIHFDPFFENVLNSVEIVDNHDRYGPIVYEDVARLPTTTVLAESMRLGSQPRSKVSGDRDNGVEVQFRSRNPLNFQRYGFLALSVSDPETNAPFIKLYEGPMNRNGFVPGLSKRSSPRIMREFIVTFAKHHGYEFPEQI